MSRATPGVHVGFRLDPDLVAALDRAAALADATRTEVASDWLRIGAEKSGLLPPIPRKSEKSVR